MGLHLFGKYNSYAEVRKVDISRTSFTLNFFIKQTGKISAIRTIFGDWTYKWQFLLRIWSNDIMAMTLRRNRYNTGSDPRQDMITVYSTNKFNVANQWYAVSFVWDRSRKSGTFHVNGRRQQPVYSKYSDRDLQDSSRKSWYRVGFKGDSRNEWFQGYIVGLSIFGEVLSDKCIQAIHNKIK
jgi:hypothetical protein